MEYLAMKPMLITLSLLAAGLTFTACGDDGGKSGKNEASRYRAACQDNCPERVACGIEENTKACRESCEGQAFAWGFILDFYAAQGGGNACRKAMGDFIDCMNAITYTCTGEGQLEPNDLPAKCENVGDQLDLHCDLD